VFRTLIPNTILTDLHTFLSLSFLPVCSRMMAVYPTAADVSAYLGKV
jgi:hypothetical protein